MALAMKGTIDILNGHATRGVKSFVNKKIVHALASANVWSSSEYNSNNAWNVNFSSGNTNNNNKYNSNVVRAVAALDESFKVSFWVAYMDCCKHKMGSSDCIMFRLNDEILILLIWLIHTRQYKPTTSETFVVKIPKYREIFAAAFIDRIVQHWIYLRINPLFEQRFIEIGDVSYNCRKGYGTLSARQKLFDDMHHFGFESNLFVGRYDVRSFFMTMKLDIIWNKLEPFLNEKYQGNDLDVLLYLSEITIFHRPQDNCIRKGDLTLWRYVADSKSLFGKDLFEGMAIGNITTQVLANFYMSFFDEWVLEKIASFGYSEPERHYIRFVDDFALHSMTAKHINMIFKEALVWLWDNLGLRLHENKVYLQPQIHGVKFIGGVIMPGRKYIINCTIEAFRERLRYTEELCRSIVEHGKSEYKLYVLQHSVSSLNSYEGFLRHGKTYKIQKRLMLVLIYFWKVCYTTKNLGVVKIRKDYQLSKYLYKNEQELQQREAVAYRERLKRGLARHQFRRSGRRKP